MPEDKSDLLQGTLDLLILTTLALEPMHGLGVARRIGQVTRGAFEVKPDLCSRHCTGWKRRDGCAPSGANRKTGARRSTIR